MSSTTTENQPAGNKKKRFTLCVFCGSSPGVSSKYLEAVQSLAECMHANSWSLVYGGGTLGLMGALARSLVNLAGPAAVHGIIPRALLPVEQHIKGPPEEEFGHTTLVSSMHERKLLMAQEADAFMALPGGYGTMEEFFEVVTWNQLGIHARPIVLYNVGGFYDDLLRWVDNAVKQGFISEGVAKIINESKTADEVVMQVKMYEPAVGRYQLDWQFESA